MKNHVWQFVGIFFIAQLATQSIAGELQLGLAIERLSPEIKGGEIENELAPLIIYRDGNFTFDSGTFQYKFYESGGLRFEALGKSHPAVYDTDDSNSLEGMDELDDTFDIGFGISKAVSWGAIELEVLNDVSGTDEGATVNASFHYPVAAGNWLIEPVIGINWQNSKRVDYAYGVSSGEVRPGRSAYEAGDAMNPFVELNTVYKINDSWMLLGGLTYSNLDNTITESPIVEESSKSSFYGGVVFKF